jgi:hypothetical protein
VRGPSAKAKDGLPYRLNPEIFDPEIFGFEF